jgi:hypothetical protein
MPNQTTGKYIVASFYIKFKTTTISDLQIQIPIWDGVNEYYNSIRLDYINNVWQYAPDTYPSSPIGWVDIPVPSNTSIDNKANNS